jgi:asparagine N-glycosylation enzyme membrane subunit Stt3
MRQVGVGHGPILSLYDPRVPRPVPRPVYALNLALASLLLALLAWHRHATVASVPGGRFEDPDSLFHAHRVLGAIRTGSWLPAVFDPFENFPDGGRALWPPLHDAVLTLAARLGGSTREHPEAGMLAAAAVPVVEIGLALLVAAAIARREGGRVAGIAAAWLFATTPCLARRSAFGDIDHNATEILFGLVLLLVAGRSGGRAASAPKNRETLSRAALWTAAVLLALGFYAGLVLAAGVAALAAFAAALLDREPPRLPGIAAGFALAALALPLFASLRVAPDPADPWRLGPPFTLLLAAGGLGAGFAGAFVHRRELVPFRLAAGAAAISFVAAALVPPAAFGALAKGFGFLGSRNPWLSTIDEFQPLLRTPGALVAALPALLVAAAGLAAAAPGWRRRSRAASASLAFVAVPFTLYALLALVQKRFLPVAAAFAAVVGGTALALLRDRSLLRWGVIALAGIGFLPPANAYLIPYLAATFDGKDFSEGGTAGGLAAGILRDVTPDPGNPPAWGVLAPWDYGHDIIQFGGRAVALDNFGSAHPGFPRATRIFLSTSPAEALAELSDLRLRYVVAGWPPNVLPSAATSLGEDPATYLVEGQRADAPPPYRLTPKGERTLLGRLHLRDARPFADDSAADRAALSRLKLVAASRETGPGPDGPIPFLKVFEVLPPPR